MSGTTVRHVNTHNEPPRELACPGLSWAVMESTQHSQEGTVWRVETHPTLRESLGLLKPMDSL